MTREEAVLAALAAGCGEEHEPVHIQKLLFLIDRKIPKRVGGPHFNFEPYHYGPFDGAVYQVLGKLEDDGLLSISSHARWRTYRLTTIGQEKGERALGALDDGAQSYIRRLSEFVRSLTFTELVSAIYKAFPEMRQNSVFQE